MATRTKPRSAAEPSPRVEFRPLTADRFFDLEALFGERGACGGCWCMWWQLARAEFNRQKGAGNRRAMKRIVDSGEVPGILAYAGLSVAMRPAIGQVFRAGDGEEAGQPGGGAANGLHGSRQVFAHFRHARAHGREVAFRRTLQVRPRGKEARRAGARLVQVEINAHTMPPRPLDEQTQVLQPRLKVFALPRIPRKRRQPRQDCLQPYPVHARGGQARQIPVRERVQRRIEQRIAVESKIGIAVPRREGAGRCRPNLGSL